MSSEKPVLLASDVHLGAVMTGRERDFMAWLEHAATAASWIILNGDLFDFWFEYRSGVSQGHDEVLALLREIVDAGVPFTLMGGNHDWWGGRYLRDEIGIEFLQRSVVREIGGKRTLLAHGDGLGKGDLRYHALRTVLRAWPTRAAFGLLPPSLGDELARRVSRTDRKWGVWGEEQRARSDALEAWARERLVADPELELVILGHTHEPRLRRVGESQWYVNSGDWVVHRSYVTIERGAEPRLAEWDGNLE